MRVVYCWRSRKYTFPRTWLWNDKVVRVASIRLPAAALNDCGKVCAANVVVLITRQTLHVDTPPAMRYCFCAIDKH